MHKLLTAPTWKVFISLLLCWFSFALGLEAVFVFLAVLTYCIFFLGNSLYKKLPFGHDLKIKRFYFHLFAIIFCFGILVLLLDSDFMSDNKSKIYNWTIAIIVLSQCLLIYSYLYVNWFTTKPLRQLINRE